MSFNSYDFILFFVAVFLLYWNTGKMGKSYQNIVLLAASYFFYGYWDLKFLLLLLGLTVFNYLGGKYLAHKEAHRKYLLCFFISINLAVLFLFKYFGFFIESFQHQFGIEQSTFSVGLHLVLPLCISFYILQAIGYLVDVYKKKTETCTNILHFSLFISFFPQMVAGPIERANNLIPQLSKKRLFKYEDMAFGFKMILWGFFKKLVIADNLGHAVNFIFNDYANFSGLSLFLGLVFFGIQIYADFSGYSDIAIGTSRMLGIELKDNFTYPYFSKNIREFWHKWHISLSSWFRDYVYIPMGGKSINPFRHGIYVLVVFSLSGLWHGADFHFIAWGATHACLYLFYVYGVKDASNSNKSIQKTTNMVGILATFFLVNLAWVFFRANSATEAFNYLWLMFANIHLPLSINGFLYFIKSEIGIAFFFVFMAFVFVEFLGRKWNCPLSIFDRYPRYIKYGVYYLLFIFLFLFTGVEAKFIYFQF